MTASVATGAGRSAPAWSWRTAIAALAVVALYVALRLPGLAVPLDRDEGTFGLMGQVINRGGLPYRDALDHKPPVAFYLNALALHFVPATPQGIHVFVLLYNLLTLICLFLLAKVCFRSIAAGLWCGFAYAVFSASPAIQGFTASTEMYALLPSVLSLLLALLWADNPRPGIAVLSGIAGAIACWTKQTAFTSVLFAFLFICLDSLRNRNQARSANRWSRVASGPLCWLAGATLFSAGVALWFYAHGIFSEFIFWCFRYELSYARVPLSETLEKMPRRLAAIARGDLMLPLAGIAVALWNIIRNRPRAYFLLGYLALSFLGTVPGYTYRHYFVQLAPAVALAGGYGIYVLLERVRPHGFQPPAAALCAVLIVGVSVAANRAYFFSSDPNAVSREFFGDNPFPEAPALAAYLASVTQETDRVLVVGSEPEILFYAARQSPSPFIMFYPLTDANPHYREFQNQMWRDVRRAAPKYIVFVENIESSYLWDDAAESDIIDNLNDYIKAGYKLERRMLVAAEKQWIGPGESVPDSDDPFISIYRRNDGDSRPRP